MDTQQGILDHRELLSEHSGHSQGQTGHGPTPLLGGASESASDGDEGARGLIVQSWGRGLLWWWFPMISEAGAS